MTQRVLLDLYCGGGGATKGYQRAGFVVIGVDNRSQPHYCGDGFVIRDALESMETLIRGGRLIDNKDKTWYLKDFAAIHASPPCQRYSCATRANGIEAVLRHPDLIPETRRLLIESRKPYVVENVTLARQYLDSPLLLCGTMFGLNVIRHRYFETAPRILLAPMSCRHHKPVVRQGYAPNEKQFQCVVGHFANLELGKIAMGIDWMETKSEVAESIPPVYTEFIGKQLTQYLDREPNLIGGPPQ